MTTNNIIRTVLKDHPEFKSFKQVQEECANLGTEVGLWAVYFVAKSDGRKLERDSALLDTQEDIHDVALTFLGLHKSLDKAVATLNEVKRRNNAGDIISWELESNAQTETWELSVGQELVDLCKGSVDDAIEAVTKC